VSHDFLGAGRVKVFLHYGFTITTLIQFNIKIVELIDPSG